MAATYPPNEYYRYGQTVLMQSILKLHSFQHRYNGHWRNVTQQLAFLGALMVYLENETLLTLEDFQQLLGGEIAKIS